MAIPVGRALRLLNALIGVDTMPEDQRESMFRFWMKEGISLTPDLDLQDASTLARILSGESYGTP